MKTIVLVGAGLLLPLLAGCSMTPERRAAIDEAWAARDRERAAECASVGMMYISGSCVPREGRPG